VSIRGDERLEILTRDETRRGMISPAFFDERNEKRTGAHRDRHVRIQSANRPLVRTRLDRARRADDTDVTTARRRDRRSRSRLDDADHWHVHLFAQCAKRVRGGGIAGDDDALHSLIAKKTGDFATVPSNGFRTLRAVWDASRVAEVDDTFVRELANHLFGDREPTDP
jgi:hypothetical protein